MPNKKDLDDVKIEQQIDKIRRQILLDRWNDIISFGFEKLSGVLLTLLGSIEFWDPDIISAVTSNPPLVAALGIGLLTKRKLFKLLNDINNDNN